MGKFKIGELAAAAGVSRDTIRYYERTGLLLSPGRSGAGYRLYGDDDLLRLRFIRSGQELGFTLAEISALLTLQTSDTARASAVLAITRDKIRQAETRVIELNRIRTILEGLVAACPGEAPTRDCPILAFISARPRARAAAKPETARGGRITVKPDSEGMTMKTYAIAAALAAATLLSACATTPPTESQIASCRQMESDMGVADRHDHSEMKGQGRNAMNVSHDRCRRILRQSK